MLRAPALCERGLAYDKLGSSSHPLITRRAGERNGPVVRRERLGGVLNFYDRRAA